MIIRIRISVLLTLERASATPYDEKHNNPFGKLGIWRRMIAYSFWRRSQDFLPALKKKCLAGPILAFVRFESGVSQGDLRKRCALGGSVPAQGSRVVDVRWLTLSSNVRYSLQTTSR